LLVVEDDAVRFAHPLLASVVYGRMGPLERRRLHAGLAADAVDPDVHARHLALSADEPDAATAARLEEAAGRARSRGAVDIAAEFGRHSVRLTPDAGTEDRYRRALAQVADLAQAGDVGRAIEVSSRLIEELPPGPARAEALVQHSDLETDHPELVIASLERALEEAGGDGPLRRKVLQELGLSRFLCLGDLRGALVDVREAVTLVVQPGDARQSALTEACLAHLEAIAGRPNPEVMARTVALEDELAAPRLAWRPRVLLAKQRRWAGELEAARTLRAGGDSSTENQRPYRLYDLALIECSAGDFAAADELVKQGLEAARDAGDGFGERAFWYPLGVLQAWLGRAEAARETARRLLDRAEPLGDRLDVVASRRILGLAALAEGDYESAVQELGEGARLLREIGIGNPGFYPVLPDAVEALARTGDLTGAVELLEHLESQARSVGSAWAATVAERSHGLVLLSCGETERAASLLERAAASFDELGHRPDAARALLALGQARWRGGRRTLATEALEDAREQFAGMGAALWEQRASEELARVSTHRGTDELTPVERRVAALVVSGRKNREVAQELFLSIATVEAHLTRIYRKLEIRSRSELARALDEGL
jgi:DNA-binding CsgD family transcriptional regulator